MVLQTVVALSERAVEIGGVVQLFYNAAGVPVDSPPRLNRHRDVRHGRDQDREESSFRDRMLRVLKQRQLSPTNRPGTGMAALTSRSPDMFAPAKIPVAAGKKMANTEKKFWSVPSNGL